MRAQPILTTVLLGLSANAAFGADNLTNQAILDAVQTRQKVVVSNNLRTVVAYFLGESGGCANVAVETSIKRGRDSYRVCGNEIIETADVAPAAPSDDPNYRRTVVAIGKQALLNEIARGRFEGYLIEGRRVGWPANDGCGIVDVTVTYNGSLVDNAQPRVCP